MTVARPDTRSLIPILALKTGHALHKKHEQKQKGNYGRSINENHHCYSSCCHSL